MRRTIAAAAAIAAALIGAAACGTDSNQPAQDPLNGEGKTILFVTHDRELAARAQRIVEIRDGIVVGG